MSQPSGNGYRSRAQQAKFERRLIGAVVAFIVVMSIIGLLTNPYKITSGQMQPTLQPGTHLLLNLVNQRAPLRSFEAAPFDASGTIKLDYICARDVAGGVEFHLENKSLMSVWHRLLATCPASGSDEIAVSPGTYELFVLVSGGDAGWGITITQE